VSEPRPATALEICTAKVELVREMLTHSDRTDDVLVFQRATVERMARHLDRALELMEVTP
jgi:hypothetical protein